MDTSHILSLLRREWQIEHLGKFGQRCSKKTCTTTRAGLRGPLFWDPQARWRRRCTEDTQPHLNARVGRSRSVGASPPWTVPRSAPSGANRPGPNVFDDHPKRRGAGPLNVRMGCGKGLPGASDAAQRSGELPGMLQVLLGVGG